MRELIKHIINEVTSTKKSNTNDFIQKAKLVHGDKYDYDLVNYSNSKIPVEIICPVHGVFKLRPNDHLQGQGCKKCGVESRSKKRSLGQEEFINRAELVHNGIYDYSKVDYKNSVDKVIITCPVHGDFEQSPGNHLNGFGCYKCGRDTVSKNMTSNTDEFIINAKRVHGDKYNYDKVLYVKSKLPVIITCPKHGDFEQSPGAHIKLKQGCPYCNESKGERLIQTYLKNNSIEFIRQKTFQDCKGKSGKKFCRKLPFDFYLPSQNIIIEYDGRQHFEPVEAFGGMDGFEATQLTDQIKNEYCKNNNIKLIRISYKLSDDEVIQYLSNELM
jgi:hypothetical protein